MPVIGLQVIDAGNAQLRKYTVDKLIKLFWLLTGLGLFLHYIHEGEGYEASILTLGVLFLTTVALILLIGKMYNREPCVGAYIVINNVVFVFYVIIGYILLLLCGPGIIIYLLLWLLKPLLLQPAARNRGLIMTQAPTQA